MGLRRISYAILMLFLFAFIGAASAGDPTGELTYTGDIDGLQTSLDFVFIFVGAVLVFFMQVGFALLGAGLIRVKNTVNYLTKCYMDFSLGALAFWAIGFAIMFGGSGAVPGLDAGNSLIGFSGWGLMGDAYDVSTAIFLLFQLMFATAAATIVAGAVAERMRYQAYMIYSFVITAFIYSIFGHWVWGGGWLSQLPFGAGAVDFAGSGVVHAVGGFVSLVAAYMVGPRMGKYNADGTPNVIPGHNLTYVIIGTMILFFGWFGFNAASTLSASDLRLSMIAINTLLAGATGAVVVSYYTYFKYGIADMSLICNGALAGLVGITAGCAFVAPWSAVVIGAIAGMLMIASVWFIEWKLRVDDPVGAVSVHGANGIWGLIAVGIFADGTYHGVSGLIVGQTSQLVAQLITAGTAVVWALACGILLFGTLKYTIGIRTTEDMEVIGLDMGIHGATAYPEWGTSK